MIARKQTEKPVMDVDKRYLWPSMEEMKPMKIRNRALLIIILMISLLALICVWPVIAGADQDFTIPGEDYVLPDASEYVLTKAAHVDSFFYGEKSMGALRMIGPVSKVSNQDDYTAYGVNGAVSLYYTYDGDHRDTSFQTWYVDDDAMGKVHGYDFGGIFKGVGHGCILIEESENGKEWSLVRDPGLPKLNYFTEPRKDEKAFLFTVPEETVKNGHYYRVVVAYRFCKKTGNGIIYIGDQFEYKKCIELYQFYVCSENNYVTIRDMGNGLTLQDQDSTDTGFIICKNGSNAMIKVEGKEEECRDYDFFADPGEYVVKVTTELGKEYQYTIDVTGGVDFTPLKGTIYRSEKDTGFTNSTVPPNTVFGGSLTSLSLVTPKGTEIVSSEDQNFGISGKSVSLYLKLNKDIDNLGNNWVVNDDKWGERKNQTIGGIEAAGPIGKGALLIQTSRNGKNWVNAEKGKYANGLYTTDYASYYGQAQNVLIYTPSGDDVINGIHIMVRYAYQVYHPETKDYRDYLEIYRFYLCNNNLNAVTFHNLSVAGTLADEFRDADQNAIEVYTEAETLISGSYTTTGFRIDNSLNPTANYKVVVNNEYVDLTGDTFESPGKYDITLISAVGSTRESTIYVDRSTPEEAMQKYFGDGFVSGKRIFSEGEYPVYEGGETAYHVAAVDVNTLPLYGQIVNQTTGSVIEIEQNHEMKSHLITEPGDYQAVFSTSKAIFNADESLKGDARIFTFRFHIIAQGTAPGPVVNQKLLDEYRRSTVSDSNPVYYGLTYSSATKGNITIAFATWEEAKNYAYQYESGTVEKQNDGAYRYTGSFIVKQKTKFDSAWDLTDAMNYFAAEAVQKHCFDMSDEFTYLSLTDEMIESTSNLRQLELPQSVTIFADGQKTLLTDIDALPLLNDKPYAYLNPITGETDHGYYHFEFITDQYGGIDSSKVTIIDSQGGQHPIQYSTSVGWQLLKDNCPSGIVTVREETKYGDAVEYKAMYIAPNENQTQLKLTIMHDGNSETKVFNSHEADPEKAIEVESFAISEINDPIDPYALVIVRHHQREDIFTAKDLANTSWSEPGIYRITCVNRMGYGYQLAMVVPGIDETAENEQINPESTSDQGTVTESRNDNVQTNENPTLDESTKEQMQQSASTEKENEIAASERKATGGNNVPLIIGIIIGVALLAGLCILAYKRIKIFSRMTDDMKGEDDKHE